MNLHPPPAAIQRETFQYWKKMDGDGHYHPKQSNQQQQQQHSNWCSERE
jgi:hypothetical protein